MISARVFNNFLIVLFLFMPLVGKSLVAQVSTSQMLSNESFVEYHNLKLRTIENVAYSDKVSKPSDLTFSPLTPLEDEFSKDLNSHWVWSENTLETIDSYSAFLFRTKKSAKVEEVKVLLQVNSMGRLSGFEVLSDVDKGLQERIDYVLRKLPACKPVPGYANYGIETFELIIKK